MECCIFAGGSGRGIGLRVDADAVTSISGEKGEDTFLLLDSL
jgi:hypothetical protein